MAEVVTTRTAATEAPVRLRAHHLLCVLTYVGRGYSERFVATMSEVVGRIGAGETFEVVVGPDSLCAAIDPDSVDAAHCHAARNRERDARATRQLEVVLGRPLRSPMSLSADDLRSLRTAFAGGGAMREPCVECEWRALCDEVSASGFVRSELLRATP